MKDVKIMSKNMIKSIEDLKKIKAECKAKNDQYKYKVLVCGGAGCISSNCYDVKDALIKSIEANQLTDDVFVSETGCMGTCDIGPVILVQPGDVFYTKLNASDISEIVTSHFINGEIKLDKTYYDLKEGRHIPHLYDINYFKQQVKIALKNCGSIDYN